MQSKTIKLVAVIYFSIFVNNIAYSADSTALSNNVPSPDGMYWDCNETKLITDPSNTSAGNILTMRAPEYWRYDAEGGGWGHKSHNVYCYNQYQNPSNSIPIGIANWRDPASGVDQGVNRYYYLCGHLVSVCQWKKGPPPPQGLNTN